MRILGGGLTEIGKSWIRVIIFSIIAIVAIVTAALSSFMVTEAGTKEHNWWIFLMVISLLAVGGTLSATGVSIYAHVKLTKPSLSRYVTMPSTTAPTVVPTAPVNTVE